ncbi:MAG TPA: phosphatidylserine decarboxylase family protein [Geobacteraceae bacterium]|nr:phosphatidylserine decarboxylase family protein [Geobacteraceae bacterium]
MRNQNTPVAVEGVPFIVVFGASAAVLYFVAASMHSGILFALSGVAALLTLFTVFFFRNPHRLIPAVENGVIAPADGRIIFLGEAREEQTGEEMLKVSIFMSVFNVHINRVPLTGRIIDNFYVKGKFLDVRDERATFENERNGLVIETSRGLRVVVVQVAGLIARRIVCYPRVGEMVIMGQRYGLIRFGSRLDVFLPKGAEILVKAGEKTVCGETVLGILP